MAEHETMDDLKEEMNTSFRQINEDDVLKGTVIAVNDTEVTLDLGLYAPGIIHVSDLNTDPQFSVKESIHTGDELEATVICTDDGNGNILLSMKDAAESLAWNTVQQYMDEGRVLTVKVAGILPSGAVTYVEGLRGFIPISHLCEEYITDTTPWLGKTLDVKIITVDRAANRFVLSRKEVEMEEKEQERAKKIASLDFDTVYTGTVQALMTYGAFIKLENDLIGLVHISQICSKRITDLSKILTEGQTVKVKVINITDDKFEVSMRALEDEVLNGEKSSTEYISETVSTNLGTLLANIKLN